MSVDRFKHAMDTPMGLLAFYLKTHWVQIWLKTSVDHFKHIKDNLMAPFVWVPNNPRVVVYPWEVPMGLLVPIVKDPWVQKST